MQATQVSPTWFQTFFSGMFNESWRMLRSDMHTLPETDFIESYLPHPAAEVLDAPCGGGRHAVALAARGHRVTGVDLCEEFLDEARAASALKGLEVTWERRDMRDLPWASRFDAALCMGTSFGFLDEPADLEYAVAVQRALKPGGVFIVDTNKIAEITLASNKQRGWARLNDIMLTYEHHYDCETALERTDYEFFRDGTHEQKSCTQRIYSFHELCGLMRRAGFAEVKGFSSLDKKPVRLGLQRLLLVARKAGGAA